MTRFLAVDTETHLIAPGMVAPRLVCVSTFDGEEAALYAREDGLRVVEAALRDPETVLITHNGSYDFGVFCAEDDTLLPLVWQAYEEGRIRDTMVRQQLLDISTGSLKFVHDEDGNILRTDHALASLVWRFFQKKLAKEDTWRLRYAELDGVPIERWPEEAKSYALLDAQSTWEVFCAQAQGAEVDDTPPTSMARVAYEEEVRQTTTAWVLHLMSLWGVRTDGKAVAELEARLRAEKDAAMKALEGAGATLDVPLKGKRGQTMEFRSQFFPIFDANGKRNLKVIQKLIAEGFAAQGRKPPMNPGRVKDGVRTPEIAYREEVLRDAKVPALTTLADISSTLSLLNKNIPVLKRGAHRPISARWNVLVETGRTSCSGSSRKIPEPLRDGDNFQNPPQRGGVRECIVPREGFLFIGADYDQLELRTLAQTQLDLLGSSSLAEAFKRGEDPHLNYAANRLGISVEEAKRLYDAFDETVRKERKYAKPANFGFPGGLGAASYVEYAKSWGLDINEDQAYEAKRTFFRTWVEMEAYFEYITQLTEDEDTNFVVLQRSYRVRGRVRFTSAANLFFQGPASDLAKDALRRVSKRCYLKPESALYGSRPVLFLHDEIICESPADRAAEAAEELQQVMESVGEFWLPGVPLKASPCVMPCWYKDAEAIRDPETRRLVPWSPELVGAMGFAAACASLTKERR